MLRASTRVCATRALRIATRPLSSSATETVPLPEVDRLLLHGIKSIGCAPAAVVERGTKKLSPHARDG